MSCGLCLQKNEVASMTKMNDNVVSSNVVKVNF